VKGRRTFFAIVATILTVSMSAAALNIVFSNTLTASVPVQQGPLQLFWKPPASTVGCDVAVPGSEMQGTLTVSDVYKGDIVCTAIRLKNPASHGFLVIVKFNVQMGAGVPGPSDLTLQFFDGTNWQPLTWDGNGNGQFGPSGGFTVGAGYDATTELRAQFFTDLTYAFTVWTERIVSTI